jgi:dihydroorotate dehydrogenase
MNVTHLFGPIWGASGVQGFFGEGYRHHQLTKRFGGTMDGLTFVAKTCTVEPTKGNMPLREDFTPAEFKPACISVNLRAGAALNKVGLSNPGLEALLATGQWQERRDPFLLSFMQVSAHPAGRELEAEDFGALLKAQLGRFHAPVGLQVNFSCPNVGHGSTGTETRLREVEATLETLAGILGERVPLIPKLDVTWSAEHMHRVMRHHACAGICFSNTVKYGTAGFSWTGLFPKSLEHIGTTSAGGGGLSGAPLYPHVLAKLRELHEYGVPPKPLNVGGGIMQHEHVSELYKAGASSLFLGTVTFTRWWRTQKLIDHARIRWSLDRPMRSSTERQRAVIG